MGKNYQKWIGLKRQLQNSTEKEFFFSEAQVWHCHMGENIGYEQDGYGDEFLRPVIILKKFNKQIFWGIPLTHTIKNLPVYFRCNPIFVSGANTNESAAVLSQIRLMDARRLRKRFARIEYSEFRLLTEKFKALLP